MWSQWQDKYISLGAWRSVGVADGKDAFQCTRRAMPPGQVLTQPYPARCLMQMSPFCHISHTSDIHIRLCCSSLLSCSLFVNTTDGQGVTPCLPPTVWPAHKTACHLLVPSVCLPHPHNYACHHVSPCLPAQVGLYTGLYGSLTTLSAFPPPPSPFLTTLCPPPPPLSAPAGRPAHRAVWFPQKMSSWLIQSVHMVVGLPCSGCLQPCTHPPNT